MIKYLKSIHLQIYFISFYFRL